MAGIGHFNADDVDPQEGFEPFPPGEYMAVITNSEIKATKDNPNQKYLKLEYKIVSDGPGKGRLVFNNLNLWHSNPQTVKIAEQTLSAICRAVGKRQIQDSVELHGTPLRVVVDIKPASGQYSASNFIKKHLFEDTTEGTKTATAQAGQALAGTPGKAPWDK